MTTFKPQSSLTKGLWIFAVIFFGAFLLIGLTSDTATPESLARGLTLLGIFLLIFPIIGTFFIKIRIDSERIKASTWLAQKNILISKVDNIEFKKSLVGLITDIRVSYTDKKGSFRTSIIGTLEAYGEKNVSKILKDLLRVNPHIKLDSKGENLIREL